MLVVKRDGRKVKFDENKIVQAILKAFKEVDGDITDIAKKNAAIIADLIKRLDTELSVEEIQDMVEDKLMSSDRTDVARAYIIYRNDRSRERERKKSIPVSHIKPINCTGVKPSQAIDVLKKPSILVTAPLPIKAWVKDGISKGRKHRAALQSTIASSGHTPKPRIKLLLRRHMHSSKMNRLLQHTAMRNE